MTLFINGGQQRTAVLAAAAMFNQDRAGPILFSNRVEALVQPGQGRKHTQRLIHTLLTTNPAGQGTNVDLAFQTAERALKQRGVILLISDFLTPPGGSPSGQLPAATASARLGRDRTAAHDRAGANGTGNHFTIHHHLVDARRV